MRAKGEIESVRHIGRHGRLVADWLDENGYQVLAIIRAKHFKVRLSKDGVERNVMMASSPKNDVEAFECIRQMVQRTFRG